MAGILIWTNLIAVILLAVYGLIGMFTLWLYWRHRGEDSANPSVHENDLPAVTVQLPVYNERYVVERLIRSVVNLDYPSDRLQVQVIDDSDDDTAEIAARLISDYRNRDIKIEHVRRIHRTGFKAGALSEANEQAEGEFLAIFDADFQPQSDFLLKTIPYFRMSPELGMIQARWGHMNADVSPFTAAQSIALDKHFVMEQTVRHRANLFPKFNGAAGVWRRQCLNDAGGWLDDTVCEDLCLSTRAILKGWRFLFLPDVIAPAELPLSSTAYKNQQARWAKGSIQCLHKYWIEVLRNQRFSLGARFYALISMSAYATHFLLLLLLLLQIPLIILDVRLPSLMWLFTVIGLGQPLLFILAQKESYSDWVRRLLHFPTLLLVAVGTAPSNSRAMLQAFLEHQHPFVRTPKGISGRQFDVQADQISPYNLGVDSIWFVEVFFAVYAGIGTALAIANGNFGPLFLLITSMLGLSYVAWLGVQEIPFLAILQQRKNVLKYLKAARHGRDIS